MVTEGDSGTMLVNRLYERKPWWLIAQALIDSSAWVLSVLFAYMLRYSVLLSNGSVFDIIHPASLTMTATLAVVLVLACRRGCFERGCGVDCFLLCG